MKKRLVIGFVFVFCFMSSLSAHAGKKYPLNELPMYGLVEKTPVMIKADNDFFEVIKRSGLSREEASEDAIGKG